VLVHLTHERTNLRFGKFANAFSENGFVFGQDCKRMAPFGSIFGHDLSCKAAPRRPEANVIIGPRARASRSRLPEAGV
jgi:hypothetical protein